MKPIAQKVTAKLFLGILLAPDSKSKLMQSKKWHENQLNSGDLIDKMALIHHQKKEYLGFFIHDSISMDELRASMPGCLEQYRQHFSDAPIEALKLTIFPQIFIS